jgi:hypothetical protein
MVSSAELQEIKVYGDKQVGLEQCNGGIDRNRIFHFRGPMGGWSLSLILVGPNLIFKQKKMHIYFTYDYNDLQCINRNDSEVTCPEK